MAILQSLGDPVGRIGLIIEFNDVRQLQRADKLRKRTAKVALTDNPYRNAVFVSHLSERFEQETQPRTLDNCSVKNKADPTLDIDPIARRKERLIGKICDNVNGVDSQAVL